MIHVKEGTEAEVEQYLSRKFEKKILKITRCLKEDLDLENHLTGRKRLFIVIYFRNCMDLLFVRRHLLPIVKKNQTHKATTETYEDHIFVAGNSISASIKSDVLFSENVVDPITSGKDCAEYIMDIREYDIPYYLRVAIDLNIRVGHWYSVNVDNEKVGMIKREELVERAEPVIMAFDIETTKQPLKFPDVKIDMIIMISYMIDGQGYLIINREIVAENIHDFEYTPRPEFEGFFTVFNEPNELALLRKFFAHIQQTRPTIFVTYNGDFFDWPFIEARAGLHGIDMFQEIGFKKDKTGEYKSRFGIHMDVFRWVKRDSYLPAGSHGLKAVTTQKLGYNPLELDPEDMTRFAMEQPQTLASYSVSDAVATYYLYMKYVHPFIFSLCNIIPLQPDEVLRKGSGTLCETLLMACAHAAFIIMPNKQEEEHDRLCDGHLLDTETYIGGHVESLESGVFRNDLPVKFRIESVTVDSLIKNLGPAIENFIRHESLSPEEVLNLSEVHDAIQLKLEDLRSTPNRTETPLIYHLDVAAMYPNIILTNRLQPPSIVDESTCAACDFNMPGMNCQRSMKWTWRGEVFPPQKNEMDMIKRQLESEKFFDKRTKRPTKSFYSLSTAEQSLLLRKRISLYSRKVYKKIHITKVKERESLVCMRENSFYVNAVRDFRDRRYAYKALQKDWKKRADEALQQNDLTKLDECRKKLTIFDSLQLAHKCILNSFYGYVMRRGARWYSMEMAGIVCQTGANIIRMTRRLVEQLGRPLELDTDGIWCILPSSFPENFMLKTSRNDKSQLLLSYPCVMLNFEVHNTFTNHQYQELVDPENFVYITRSENSIFFEVDGPYRAMVLPAAKEEDKRLKKRYAVFNTDGTLAELKGFEVKRRGELKLIKIFQTQIFERYLAGSTLEECYASVAQIANQWLDVLYSKGVTIEDDELFDLISENRNMSKTLSDYGTQKSTSISTAKRLAEFLGDKMVKDKGLNCRFVISARPLGAPVAERAIPVAIFAAEINVKKHYLRKWLKDTNLTDFDLRSILDWDYYIDRFGSAVQKLITIPAAMQHVENPVPRVRHPDWLYKRFREENSLFQQAKMSQFYSKVEPRSLPECSLSVDTDNSLPVMNRTGNWDEKYKLPMPEIHRLLNSDYSEWIGHQKSKWKEAYLRLKRKKELFGRFMPLSKRLNLTGALQKHWESLLHYPWQIVQFVEAELPGQFYAWILVRGILHKVKLAIHRTIYVNSKVIGQLKEYKASQKVLPRMRPSHYLYEISWNEQEYQRNLRNINAFFAHSDIEGIYETKVPLIFRAISKLGCLCAIDAEQLTIIDQLKGFDLHQLKFLSTKNQEYLIGNSLRFVYFYYINVGTRHIFALFFSDLEKAHIYLVDPHDTHPLEVNAIQKTYQEFYQRKANPKNSGGIFNYSTSLAVTGTNLKRSQVAWEIIEKIISDYQAMKSDCVILLQSSSGISDIIKLLPRLREFPTIALSCSPVDYQKNSYDWRRFCYKSMLNQYLGLDDWLHDQLQLARYSQIPIGNLENDAIVMAIDVFFARHLIANDHILWMSSSTKPDLGGSENDENISGIDEIRHTEINIPGAYRTVCIEIELHNLAVNTILEASRINELEGTDEIYGFNQNRPSVQPDQRQKGRDFYTNHSFTCISSFALLRNLVIRWSQEIMESQNVYADMILAHFYRWLKTSSYYHHDPSLFVLVQGLMRKLFAQLIAEIKKLGASIVFATFGRLIINTHKYDNNHAASYYGFLIKSIKSRPLFRWLFFEMKTSWEYLLWMDSTDYGGIITRDHPIESSDSLEDIEYPLYLSWNLAKFLPIALQDSFLTIVGTFIQASHRHVVVSKQDSSRRTDMKWFADCYDSDGDDSSNIRKFADEVITRDIGHALFDLIPSIQGLYHQEKDEWKFPEIPGIHTSQRDPTLEFIKFTMAVLETDRLVKKEVQKLRRNLLKLVRVPEFSSQAQFENPSHGLKLTDIICEYCNNIQEIDLCDNEDIGKYWSCPACHGSYDRSIIEHALIESLQWILVGYQLQDVRCAKCHLVKDNFMAKSCNCSGEFELTLSRHILARRLSLLQAIATHYRMEILGEMTSWACSQVSAI